MKKDGKHQKKLSFNAEASVLIVADAGDEDGQQEKQELRKVAVKDAALLSPSRRLSDADRKNGIFMLQSPRLAKLEMSWFKDRRKANNEAARRWYETTGRYACCLLLYRASLSPPH